MASNSRRYKLTNARSTRSRSLNTIENLDYSSTSSDSPSTQSDSDRTVIGITANEVNLFNPTTHTLLHETNNIYASLQAISYEYEIQRARANLLLKLRDFEIVIVCDDSGSMMTTVDNTQRTRWDELCSIVKIVLKIGVIFDSNGVDVYFLNRNPRLGIKNPKLVDQEFATRPSGYTPLAPVLSRIFESPLSRRGRDKKLLVFVATDGEPTDRDGNPDVPQLERVMLEKRRTDTTHVSFLFCSDDPICVSYLNEWDRTMTNVDVTDDFHTERETIRRCRGNNYPFSLGDYVVKALVGAIDPEIDAINEPT